MQLASYVQSNKWVVMRHILTVKRICNERLVNHSNFYWRISDQPNTCTLSLWIKTDWMWERLHSYKGTLFKSKLNNDDITLNERDRKKVREREIDRKKERKCESHRWRWIERDRYREGEIQRQNEKDIYLGRDTKREKGRYRKREIGRETERVGCLHIVKRYGEDCERERESECVCSIEIGR